MRRGRSKPSPPEPPRSALIPPLCVFLRSFAAPWTIAAATDTDEAWPVAHEPLRTAKTLDTTLIPSMAGRTAATPAHEIPNRISVCLSRSTGLRLSLSVGIRMSPLQRQAETSMSTSNHSHGTRALRIAAGLGALVLAFGVPATASAYPPQPPPPGAESSPPPPAGESGGTPPTEVGAGGGQAGELPRTGGELDGTLALGAGALIAGLGLSALAWRRRPLTA
jgi:LPXTG-motif cell wall-anchored protein